MTCLFSARPRDRIVRTISTFCAPLCMPITNERRPRHGEQRPVGYGAPQHHLARPVEARVVDRLEACKQRIARQQVITAGDAISRLHWNVCPLEKFPATT